MFQFIEEEEQNEQLGDAFTKESKDNQNDIVDFNKKSFNNIYKIPLKEKTTCDITKDSPEPPNELNELMNQNNFSFSNTNQNILLDQILQEEREINNISEENKRGRKRNRSEENEKINEHDKFSDDNLRRKCKHLVLKNSKDFINKSIKKIYKGNIGNGIFKKELQTINQKQKSDATIDFNKNFLSKTLGDIFSEDISGRFTNLPLNHNKILIIKLMNEEDEDKRNYFNKLFNITFIDCLKHFNKKKIIPELFGLKCFSDIKNEILNKYPKDGEDYYSELQYYFDNYEKIIMKKKARKKRSKKSQDLLEGN